VFAGDIPMADNKVAIRPQPSVGVKNNLFTVAQSIKIDGYGF